MLIKESSTRDEWNHLLHLFNIMVLLQPFQQFLSDPTRKQSAMSKRGQEATSSEGSSMAKPKPNNPLSARKNPPQDLWDPVNPENVDEERGGHSTLGNRCGLTQALIQSNILKWGDRKTLFLQTPGNMETGMNLRTAQGNLCGRWTQRQIFRTWRSQSFNAWPRSLNICNGSTEDQCISMGIVRVFVNESSHSSWTKLYREMGTMQEYELRGNSESVQYHTEIGIGAVWTNSEGEYDWQCHLPHGRDRHCLMIKWSSGQKQKYVSTPIPYCVWRKEW